MGASEGGALAVPRARALVAAGLRALEGRRQEVNDLNVYPVPDGDTGTNLSLTVRGILDELRRIPDDLPPAEVCRCIANAALMGARGNSGVILSQMVRGAVEAFAGAEACTTETVVRALRLATDTAYRAVRKPVNGTMLSVLRDMTTAAEEHPPAGLSTLLDAVCRAGWESVRRTPTQLQVLADAGVVDAGGYGLMIVFEAMLPGRGGSVGEAGSAETLATPARRGPVEPESRFTYCTSFLLSGPELDAVRFEESLAPLGDSLLVVGDAAQLKVHIHTDQPGTVLNMATALGVLSGIEIDNMREQTAERTARLEAYAAEDEAAGPVGETQVVAVVSGEGVKALFRSLGAGPFVEGGQSMNPSAEELLRAVRATRAPSVIILPNNKNIVMTAEQIVGLAEKEVVVLPTRSIQAGLTAMVAFDPAAPAQRNVREMAEAVRDLATGEITRAVRDSTINGLGIRQGTFIGLVNEEVVASSDDLEAVVEEVAARLIADGRELVTVLVGDGEIAERAAAAADRLRERYPQVDIEIHEGGQPLYPLLLSAE